ncbi:nitroreductase [Anaerostipes sp.]|uniref:nitroreductase n=1 Tax=Anaerostipes sp. TaxID=1872530 RepID=UPI0025865B55|nr:nitroreductase [Anaerostipes sp.]MCI5622324.1 nitroreductase [Anaerostipes sp.]
MGETLTAIKDRRSVRKFKSDMIPKEIINQIIEAGTYAATGMDRQSPIIIAVTNKELRDKLSKMNAVFMGKDESFDPFYGAPVVLIVLANKAMPTYIYDGSLVMGNLMVAAQDLGIGSCWIHRAKEEFESEEGKKILKEVGIEGEYEGIGHCVLGYADTPKTEASPRKDSYVYYIE